MYIKVNTQTISIFSFLLVLDYKNIFYWAKKNEKISDQEESQCFKVALNKDDDIAAFHYDVTLAAQGNTATEEGMHEFLHRTW